MKNKVLTYLLLSAVLMAFSCAKQPQDNSSNETGIVFQAEEGTMSTKALLTDKALKTNGNRIHVLDVLSGFTGSASWAEGDLETGGLYINDDIVYNGSVIWGYNSGNVYPWTSDGGHQFFGWYSYDQALDLTADSYFGTTLSSGFSVSNRTLSIPAKEMTTDTPQFDLLYANTGYYMMPHTSTDPVQLTMQHLFSAISVRLYNESQDQILVKNVTITGLKNKKSAVIDFVTTPATTTQTATNEFLDNALYYALTDATKTLVSGESYDLLARVKNTSVAEYRLIWPQTQEELTNATITVVYEYLADEEHIQHTANLSFPSAIENGLQPGVRYAFTLLFTQKHIELTFKVNHWIYESYEWSFSKQSISEVTELDFKGNEGYDKPNKICRIVGGTPVKGTFSIVNPSGAIWSIEPVGDVEYFTISPNQGSVDHNHPDYEFYVTPNLDPSLDRSSDKKLKFRFYVQFTDGTVHDANSEINRDNWTVILPKI